MKWLGYISAIMGIICFLLMAGTIFISKRDRQRTAVDLMEDQYAKYNEE